MELEINGAKLRVYEDGKIERFGKRSWNSKEETWFQLKGTIHTDKNGYQSHRTTNNKKSYTTSRIIYKAFNSEWDINNLSPNNTIDHININSLDNHITNLRIATASEQQLNRNCVINQKGYSWNKHNKKWQSQISINGKHTYLGSFMTEQEARQAYLDALRPSC